MTHLNLAGPATVPAPDAPVLDLLSAYRLALLGFSHFKIN